MLSGCAQFGGPASAPVSLALAPVPDDLRTCFAKYVPQPAAGPMTRQQVVALVAALKNSEGEKGRCGARLLAWYDTQAAVLAK